MPEYLESEIPAGAAAVPVRKHAAWDPMIKGRPSLGGGVGTGFNSIERSMRLALNLQLCKPFSQLICARRSIRFNERMTVPALEQAMLETATNAAGLQEPAP